MEVNIPWPMCASFFSTVSDWQSPDQFQIMIHNKPHLSQQSAPDQANTMVFQVCADQKSVDSLIIPSACAKTNILPTVAMASAWYGEGKESFVQSIKPLAAEDVRSFERPGGKLVVQCTAYRNIEREFSQFVIHTALLRLANGYNVAIVARGNRHACQILQSYSLLAQKKWVVEDLGLENVVKLDANRKFILWQLRDKDPNGIERTASLTVINPHADLPGFEADTLILMFPEWLSLVNRAADLQSNCVVPMLEANKEVIVVTGSRHFNNLEEWHTCFATVASDNSNS